MRQSMMRWSMCGSGQASVAWAPTGLDALSGALSRFPMKRQSMN